MVSYMMPGLDAIRLEIRNFFGVGCGRGFERRIQREIILLRKKGDDLSLFRGLAFAEALQTIAEAALQWRGSVGIEGYQVPQRLTAIFAEPR
jgi:hypothetical protein